MRFWFSSIAALAFAAAPMVFGGSPHAEVGYAAIPRRHNEVAHRARGDVSNWEFTGIRATWYGAGLTACGGVYSSSDFIVALSQETFGWSYPSPYCGRGIIINYGGQTARATIQDSCVACSLHSPWALDFTQGLFTHFADPGIGVLSVDWSFDSYAEQHQATTHHTTHHTTTHHTTPRHTTTHHTTPTTTSSSAAATSSSLPPTGNLQTLEEFVLSLENLLNDAA